MSLTRKFLNGMGLTAEQVDAIIEEHAATVDSLKEDRDSYREKAEQLDDVTKKYNDLKKQVDEGADDADDWKKKYEDEHKEFEDYKKSEKAKETLQNVKDAYTKLLKENKVGEKHIDSILRVTDFKAMELSDDGTLKDADKLTEGIKNDWGGFITDINESGANVPNPPSGGSNKYSSKADIMKIKDTAKRQEAIMNNPELFQ